MAWIQSHSNLKAHPKTRRLAKILGLTRRDTVGLLHQFWWMLEELGRTDRRAEMGEITHIEPESIADACDWPEAKAVQLVEAFAKVGFTRRKRKKIYANDWMEFQGYMVRERIRKRNDREEKRKEKERGASAHTPRLNLANGTETETDTTRHNTTQHGTEQPDADAVPSSKNTVSENRSPSRRPTVEELAKTMDRLEPIMRTDPGVVVVDLKNKYGLDSIRVWATLLDSLGKRNAVGHFVSGICEGWEPSDKALKRAKAFCIEAGI